MENKQNCLIQSLILNPIIVLIRLDDQFFNTSRNRENLFLKLDNLCDNGVKNIEIAWNSNPEWVNLILEIKNKFKSINIGVASITSLESFDSISSLDLNYSMSPFFDKQIHLNAIKDGQLLIPGISNIENFKEAINLGYRVVKIYPASKLGINFVKELRENKKNNIFFIGAGGIKSKNIKKFLKIGYDALVIGKELSNQSPDKDLKILLKNY